MEMTEGRAALILLTQWRPEARLSGFLRLAAGAPKRDAIPGLIFMKLLGSGADGGFTLKPSFSHQGLFASFASADLADSFLNSGFVEFYRERAVQFFAARLETISTRGLWSGQEPFAVTASLPSYAPIAALTRGSVRLLAAPRFWRYAPQAQADVRTADGCLLAAGLGEAPLLRQATFSIWRNETKMNAYARSGAHGAAIRATYAQGFFSESLFARFAIRSMEGAWNGFDATCLQDGESAAA